MLNNTRKTLSCSYKNGKIKLTADVNLMTS